MEVSCCSRAKQQQRHVQKSVLHTQSYFFCYFRPTVVVFYGSCSLHCFFGITRFYILFE